MSSFYSIVHSKDGEYDLTGIDFATVRSPALDARVDLCTYLPEPAKGQTHLPVAILLSGVTTSCWTWASYGGAHHVIDRLIAVNEIPPMLLAMPSDGLYNCGSGFLNHPNGGQYEDWIVQDLPLLIQELYPEVSTQSPLFISGLSMGGYGALRIGAKHPQLFQAFAGHSSITTLDGMAPYLKDGLTDNLNQIDRPEADVLHWLTTNREKLPPFHFDCGTGDDLITANRTLHQSLLDLHIPHTYEESPGAHEWGYWSAQLEKTLHFFHNHQA